jgi:hypothetical protein
MKSYTELRNLYGSLTNNVTTSNLTLGDQLINDAIRKLIGDRNDWPFLQASASTVTAAGTQFYSLPYNINKLKTVVVINGNVRYNPTEIADRFTWDSLNTNTNVQSNIPNYYYLYAGQIGFWPIPSTAALPINYTYTQSVKNLSNADYVTGTITATNGSATITGSGTTFTAGMVGRYLKVNSDGFWYKISGFTSATVITLGKTYQGTTGAGAAYTIGEMSILPEDYQDLPVYYAVSQYWLTNGEIPRGREYERLFLDGKQAMRLDSGNQSANVDINSTQQVINPNLTITAS